MSHPAHARLRTSSVRAVLVALLLLGLGVTACGKNPRIGPDDINTYASLGDSYSSGVGLTPVSDATCSRSSRNYPTLIAAKYGFSTFVDATCAGASSTNLFSAQKTPTGSAAPQLDQVPADADLVTIGLGLNDNGLSVKLLYPCLETNGKAPPACDLYLQQPNSVFDAAFATLAGGVKADLDDIREKAPDARIVLIGYPRLLPDGASCPQEVPLVEAAAVRVRSAMVKINDAMREAARKAGVDYLDMYTPSEGHDACAGPDRWVNGQNIEPGTAPAYHPLAAYHQAVADRLAALLEAS